MRPLIELEAESRIRLRSSWRGSGGRFEQADGRRSAGPKELRRLPSAEACWLLHRPEKRCHQSQQISCGPIRAAVVAWNHLIGCNERPRYRAAVS